MTTTRKNQEAATRLDDIRRQYEKSREPKPRKAAPKVEAVEAWAVLTPDGRISWSLVFPSPRKARLWLARVNAVVTKGRVIRVTIAPAKPRGKRGKGAGR